jgi:hypothetical protein
MALSELLHRHGTVFRNVKYQRTHIRVNEERYDVMTLYGLFKSGIDA